MRGGARKTEALKTSTATGNSIRACTYHAVDAELVARELGDQGLFLHVPYPHGGQVAALARHQVPSVLREAQAGDGLPRGVGDVRLSVLAGVVQHHGASERRKGEKVHVRSCAMRKCKRRTLSVRTQYWLVSTALQEDPV